MAEFEAGVAFLQVVPSTRGLAAKLKRELAGIRTEFGVPVTPELDRRALTGMQAQVRAALRTMPAYVITPDSSPVDREMAALRARLERMADHVVGVTISGDQARAELASIQADADRLSNTSVDIGVRVDAGAASAALAGIEHQARGLDGRFVRARFGIDGIAGATVNLLQLRSLLLNVIEHEYDLRIDANTAGAVVGIAKVVAMVGLLGGAAGVVGGFGGTLAGLGAAGAVAGAGVAATVVGFLGVGDAIGALNEQQEGAAAAAKQNATAQRAAGEAIASAQSRVKQAAEAAGRARTEGERSVADAVKAASKQVEQAERQQASAQRTLRQATSDLRTEQDALTDAWEAGRRSLQDLQDQVDGNALDQRQAAFDLADAKKALAEARATGDKDQIDRAQLAVDRQVESMDVLAKRTERAKVENDAAVKAGVAGSAEVVAANGRIAAATERQADATVAAQDADRALREARTDGAESVARAQEQASLRIADADRQVAEAQRALTQAMAQTADAGQAAADKVTDAFSQLSPEAAAFARFIFGAKKELEGLSAVASSQLFPPLQRGLQALLDQGPAISGMVGTLAGATGGALETILTTLANPTWMAFFQTLANASVDIMPILAQLFLHAAGTVRELLIQLLPLVPAGASLIHQFLGLLDALSPFIVALLAGLIPAASAFLTALRPLGPVLDALQPILLVLGQVLAQVLLAVLQALAPILVALTPLIQQFAAQWANGLVDALTTATPLIVQVFTWLSQHADTVVRITTVVGGLVAGMNPLLWVLGAVVGALHGWLVWRVISGVLMRFGPVGAAVARVLEIFLHPLGLIRYLLPLVGRAVMFLMRTVLGALGPLGWLITIFSFLYSSNEEFRNAINGVLGVLGDLVGLLMSALKPAFDTIINGAVKPLMDVLTGGGSGGLGGVIGIVAGVLVDLINKVLPPLVHLLADVIIPIVARLAQIFADVLVWVITNLVIPAIELIAFIIKNVVAPVMVWLADNVVVPMVNSISKSFDGLGEAISWVWDNVLKPVFDHFSNVIGALGEFFGWVFDRVIKPIFEGFSEFLSGNVSGLEKIWSGIKAIFSAPVKFVLDVVWNAGIGGLWDLAKKFGLPLGEFPRADTSGFASGGPIPGSSPGPRSDDKLIRVTSGEWVQPVDSVDYYGDSVMEAIRTRAIPRERLAAYALGGKVGSGKVIGGGSVGASLGPTTPQEMLAVLSQAFPGVRLTSGFRAGDPGYHGRNRAGDFAGARAGDAGAMLAINRWIASNYARSAELIYTPGINLKNGQQHTYSPAVRADHHDHVHWVALGTGQATGSGYVDQASAGVTDWFTQQVRNLFDTGTGFVRDLVNGAFPRNGTFVGDLPMNAADWAIGKTSDLFFGKAKEADAASAVGPVGAGVERWRPTVLQALQMLGLPASLADTTLRRMNQESGGNPRAINNWDINAKRGIPSKGLMQVIDPTFRANYDPRTPNDIWNPLSNVVASMKYAIGRYGTLGAAYNRKGGYDSGGIGRGEGWMWKGDIGDERVLDPIETQAYPTLTRLSQQLEAGRLPVPTGMSDRQYAAALAGVQGGDQRTAPAVAIDEAHFHDAVGVDQLMQRAEHATRSRRL